MTEIRRYASGHTYTPVPLDQRKYKINKPDDPRAVRFGSKWYLPLAVLPEAERVMPETIPDEETLTHKAWCSCKVCKRPAAKALWAKKARNR